MKKSTVQVVSVLLAGSALMGCASTGASNRAPQVALVGSLLGAGLGAIIGHQSGHTAEGAAIGGALGAGGGYVVGNEQDKAELQTQSDQAMQTANGAYAAANTVVINVTNSNGSITPVTLQRMGSEYVGPKGERYLQIPTPDQLRSVYGF